MRNKNKNGNKKISLVVGTLLVIIVITLVGLGVAFEQESRSLSTIYDIVTGGGSAQTNAAYAQMNVPNGNSTTFIGNTKIPPNSNNTMTTVVNNASNSKISTSIDRSQIAQNVTAASAFTKQNASAPISASGISTPGKHPASYPPTSYPLNNNTGNTNQTNNSTINTSTINTNTTGCKTLLSDVHVC
jgi:hypothetical protein